MRFGFRVELELEFWGLFFGGFFEGCFFEDEDCSNDGDDGVRDDDEEEDEPCLEEDIGIFDDSYSDGDEAEWHDEEESIGGCFEGLVEEVPQGEQGGGFGIVVGEGFQFGFDCEQEDEGEGECDGDGGQGDIQDGVEQFCDDDAEDEGGATDEDGGCFAEGSVGDTMECFGRGDIQGCVLPVARGLAVCVILIARTETSMAGGGLAREGGIFKRTRA